MRETGTARDGDVWLERGVQRKDGGVTVEYTIGGADSETPVRVREPIDEGVTLSEVGFHPEHEPSEWTLEEGSLSFETTVPADGSFETVFGAVADEPFLAGDPELERLDASSGGLLGSVRGIFGGGSDAEREDTHEKAEAESDPPSPEAEEKPDDEGAEGGDASVGESDDSPDEPADSDSGAEPGDGDTGETDTQSPDSDSSDDGPDDPPASTAADPAEAAADPAETAAALVELVEEDDALRESLREALDAGETEDEPAESVDTRLRHVQSRVDDLAAYTAAFEESIDEHGRPAEAFSDLQAETAGLREDVADVRAEIEDVRAEQDDIAERVDDLAAETQSLRTELAEAGEQREARLDRLESDVDGVATDLRHARDGMESKLNAVHEEVAELQSMRESLSEAFGGVDAGSGSGTESTEAERDTEPESEQPE